MPPPLKECENCTEEVNTVPPISQLETEVSLIFSKLSFFIPAGTILCDFFEFSTNLLETGTSFPEQEEETQQRQPSTGEY